MRYFRIDGKTELLKKPFSHKEIYVNIKNIEFSFILKKNRYFF